MNTPQQTLATAIANQNVERTPIKVTFGPLTVDNVGTSLKKNRESAQLRQVTEREYPSGRSNNVLFGNDEFGFVPQKNSSTRMAWIDVPMGTSVEQVVSRLQGFPHAGIQQVLSDDVILTADQKSGIDAGLTTVDTIKYGQGNSQHSIGTNGGQLLRYPANNSDGKPEGSFIPGPNGHHQFRANYFQVDMTLEEAKDKDLRQAKQVGAVGSTPDYRVGTATATPTTPSRFNVAPLDETATTSSIRASLQEPVAVGEFDRTITDGSVISQGSTQDLASRPTEGSSLDREDDNEF